MQTFEVIASLPCEAFLLLLLLLVAAAVLAQQSGDTEKKVQAAQVAADEWLKLVDSGNYGKSWKNASEAFKAAVTEDQWNKAMQSARASG